MTNYLPCNLNGRSINVNVIPTVCNLKNMLVSLKKLNGDDAKLKQWEKRSYKAYCIEDIKDELLQSNSIDWKYILCEHILSKRTSELGANAIDIYLVAYVVNNYGLGKDKFFQYIRDSKISDKPGSAQAIWQVGKGDGVFLNILNENGSVRDWEFFKKWTGYKDS
ncbi:hypothetical protein EDD70_0113 [Hydrogenoanaerobacterium saccharovorans]|uniref:Uncharacterized protein n=1 Tax=Hydrogenoanaerobacterium saccharovorans TaxID=474960 RepID=A0A1H8BNQ0_9FIRM|nr:hypothetical protein [Hydrogenoanaerobacterium saccharovorans]RPF47341.1 hypothetical protein EDD70_0113 [Hydrogenoanaerobacterium saccharovorans]SEM83754.1 hypothetical protein SAMN05216180_1981 [Hydrogenoanaerobacterium saccharovorans]